jgi:signal transduction histidine kinase
VEFQQIVLNLLNNALQAVEAVPVGHRRIKLTTGSSAAGVTFTVEDSGQGLPARAAEELFSPFAGDRPGGIGLGLAICRRIVEAHGGAIRAERVAHGGARFVVILAQPIHEEISADG